MSSDVLDSSGIGDVKNRLRDRLHDNDRCFQEVTFSPEGYSVTIMHSDWVDFGGTSLTESVSLSEMLV